LNDGKFFAALVVGPKRAGPFKPESRILRPSLSQFRAERLRGVRIDLNQCRQPPVKGKDVIGILLCDLFKLCDGFIVPAA